MPWWSGTHNNNDNTAGKSDARKNAKRVGQAHTAREGKVNDLRRTKANGRDGNGKRGTR